MRGKLPRNDRKSHRPLASICVFRRHLLEVGQREQRDEQPVGRRRQHVVLGMPLGNAGSCIVSTGLHTGSRIDACIGNLIEISMHVIGGRIGDLT